MENPRRAELLDKHRDIIAKAAKWMELDREREFQRISQANRAAALAEQNLLNSNENERRMKDRTAIREQLRFKKAAKRASRRGMSAMKKTVEIADGSSSQSVSEDVTSLQLVQETEDDARELLKSIIT